MKIALLIAPLLLLTAVPAAGTATVHFSATLLQTGTLAECGVSVPSGANGAAVLDAAVAQGCILSWSGTTYPFGTFVDCINFVCSATATFWEMFDANGSTDYGIDLYSAQDGGVLSFDYTQWVVVLP